MSKKDKDKRKKDEAKHGAWMADLRPPKSGRSERPSSPPPETRVSKPLDEAEIVASPIPPLRPITIEPPVHARGLRPDEPGYAPEPPEDFGEETQSDIAPIGPTEYAGIEAAAIAASPESVGAATIAASPPASVEQLQRQIRDLEARVDEMISRGPSSSGGPPTHATPVASYTSDPAISVKEPPRDAPPASPPAWQPGATIPAAPDWARSADRTGPVMVEVVQSPAVEPARATARDLLPTDFYQRQWGRASMRKRAEEVDEFGFDPQYEARFLPLFDFLYKTYFRVDAEGTEHIPDEGPGLIVSNHSGGPLPYDGIMLRTTLRREHREHRELRWLAEDFVYYLPFVGTAMNRLGAVRACQENAERLLASGKLCAVFPEGAKGIGKLFKDRYKLQRFGRGGFIRLCLRTRTPIVPCAIVGAEEANPMLYRIEYMTKALGIPYLPITPTFPALGPVGLLPAPTKWKVTFGEPMSFDQYGPDSADDEILVGRLAERVRTTIQSMLDRTLAGRRSVWFG